MTCRYYALLHAASAETGGVSYDIRVSAPSAADDVVAAVDAAVEAGTTHAAAEGATERYDRLEGRWRYWVDPEGPANYSEWVVGRELDPLGVAT